MVLTPKPPSPGLVQDRKTGEWYDPQAKLEQLLKDPQFIATMKRMKDK
jgi:hypothetical protein